MVTWSLAALRWRAAAPSAGDVLVEAGPYARVRHPLYDGVLMQLMGLCVLLPRWPVLAACGLAAAWVQVQARLEERDLVERVAGYRGYMARVPRFVPRLGVARPGRADSDLRPQARSCFRQADGRQHRPAPTPFRVADFQRSLGHPEPLSVRSVYSVVHAIAEPACGSYVSWCRSPAYLPSILARRSLKSGLRRLKVNSGDWQ